MSPSRCQAMAKVSATTSAASSGDAARRRALGHDPRLVVPELPNTRLPFLGHRPPGFSPLDRMCPVRMSCFVEWLNFQRSYRHGPGPGREKGGVPLYGAAELGALRVGPRTCRLLLQIEGHGFTDHVLQRLLVDLLISMMSMASRTSPSRLELKRPFGSSGEAPLKKVSLTAFCRSRRYRCRPGETRRGLRGSWVSPTSTPRRFPDPPPRSASPR